MERGAALMRWMPAFVQLFAVGPQPAPAGACPLEQPSYADAIGPRTVPGLPMFDEVYVEHVAFVWRVVRSFGVPEAGLEDAVQDVFVVVHRRLPEWEGRSAMTTWLFAIARRVASGHRRRAGTARTEPLADSYANEPATSGDPFAATARAEAAATVMAILDTMDEDRRIAFALVELEGMTVPEVCALTGAKLNTVYSRLRLARIAFEAAVRARGPL